VRHVFVLTADRPTDLVGRPLLNIHPTISMTPIVLTVDNGTFYARKEGYIASQEGIGSAYTCMCQVAVDQAVYVDVKLLGTTEVLSQHSAILVPLHEYGRFLGAYTMGI
jgi:hypothetical protein